MDINPLELYIKVRNKNGAIEQLNIFNSFDIQKDLKSFSKYIKAMSSDTKYKILLALLKYDNAKYKIPSNKQNELSEDYILFFITSLHKDNQLFFKEKILKKIPSNNNYSLNNNASLFIKNSLN